MKHMKTMHSRQTFECPSCDFEELSIEKLQIHIESGHEEDTKSRRKLLGKEKTIKIKSERMKKRDQKFHEAFMASNRHFFSSISVEDILTEEMQLQQKLTQNSNSEEEKNDTFDA